MSTTTKADHDHHGKKKLSVMNDNKKKIKTKSETTTTSIKMSTTTNKTTTTMSSFLSSLVSTTDLTLPTASTMPLSWQSLKMIILVWVGCFFVIPFVLTIQHFYDRHLMLQDPSSFAVDRMRTNTTFIRRDVPITYYRRGKLHEVLPPNGWIDDPTNDGMRVFRLYPDEAPFEIDLDQVKSTLRVMEVREDCPNSHAWAYCPLESCQMGTGVVSGEASEILNAKPSSNLYGSFAEIQKTAVDYLESTMKLPFQLDRGNFEQAFVSNFKNRLLMTQIHSNPATHSLAVQYAGRKTWLLIAGDDYLKKSGFHATATNVPYVPLKAPTTDTMDYWIYKSQPGDLFYFPPHYAHIVSTDPGPNVMLNFRKLFRHHTRRRPITFFHTIFNRSFLNGPSDDVKVTPDGKRWDHVDGEEGSKIKGEKSPGGQTRIMKYYMTSFTGIACDDDSENNADKILAKLINEAADSTP